MKQAPFNGWHIVYAADDERKPELSHSSGKIVVVGKTHSVPPPLEVGEYGLHYTDTLLNALRASYNWRPVPYICKVVVDGLPDPDEHYSASGVYVAEVRTVTEMKPLTPLLKWVVMNIEEIVGFTPTEHYAHAHYNLTLRWAANINAGLMSMNSSNLNTLFSHMLDAFLYQFGEKDDAWFAYRAELEARLVAKYEELPHAEFK